VTLPVDESFARAAPLFDAAHADDATGHASRYHAALASWVDALVPDASPALRLAARCQHLRRAELPRSAYPEGPVGYKRWRAAAAQAHAAAARAILESAGVDAETIARVGELLIKKGLRSDPEVMVFEDAIALTFLQVDFAPFAAKHPPDKVVDILRKTWAKMTPRGHAAATELAGALPADLRALVESAVAPTPPAA
jgi:hypothetical protein